MRKPVAALCLAGVLALPAAAQEPPAAVEVVSVAPDAPRFVAGADYVLWWLREGRLPATLTTSSQASQGVLGRSDTRVLYGDDRLETRHGDRFNGIRFTLGYYFDEAREVGVEGGGFFLERDSTHFKATSDGGELLARPFVNPDGSPASEVIAGQAPTGLRSGGFVGYSRIELFGEEVNFVAPLARGDAFRLDGLAGARFLQMRDRTDLTSSGVTLPDREPLFGLEDHYRAANAYYGGQVGLRGEAEYGRLSLQLRGLIGLGGNAEQVRAFGRSIFQTPAERLVTPTGLTVQASNRGTFDRGAVNMVGEAGLDVGYRIAPRVEVFGGYTFLLWEGALRSGDQVDPVVNTNAGTPPARPAIPFKEDLFWAQGVNAGIKFTW